MKKILLVVVVLILIGGAVGAWLLLGPATGFPDKKRSLYIASKAPTRQAVMDSVTKNNLLSSPALFEWLAGRMGYWEKIRPGKYEIEKGSSLLTIVRKLRNGQQSTVNLVINKLRTPQDLAKLVGRRFETDSAEMMAYLQSDSFTTRRSITADQALAYILPDTYSYFWTTSPDKIFQKLVDAHRAFWTEERKAKAARLNLTPLQVAVVASIVDEETNAVDEKDTIASVYLNRLQLGMPLQADPTVKFALQDFGLKRIYQKHLAVESPYNTYRNTGLPPGPICTPQKKTIDLVLDAPKTDYVYFVASPQFDGTHDFSVSYAEHQAKAKAYQQALTAWQQRQAAKTNNSNVQ